ncbi:MAG: SemiSWEET family sugar transporter [Alphaproteobacteria bacterium]
MLSGLELLGFVAGACTTFSFVPQVVRIWKTRSVEDVSLAMYCIFCSGVVLWIFYGLSKGAVSIIASNVLTLLLAASILVMKFLFRK